MSWSSSRFHRPSPESPLAHPSAISENGSIESSSSSLSSAKGGDLVWIQSVADSVAPSTDAYPSNVRLISGGARAAFMDRVFGRKAFDFLERALVKGALVPNRVKVVPGGLLGVEHGFQMGREHKVSGEKLVYRVSETEGI